MAKLKFKLYIVFNLHNIHINFCTFKGESLFKLTSGLINKKNKSNPNTIQLLIDTVKTFITQRNLNCYPIMLVCKGFNKVRFNVLKEILQSDLIISHLFYVSIKPFNGCRIRKKKRL